MKTTTGERPTTPATEAAAGAAAEVPVADMAAEEVQPEPSLAGNVAGGTSDSSDSGTEDEAGAGEVEE